MRTAQAPQKNSLVDVFQLKAKQIEPRLFGPQILWLSQVVASSYIV
jgi:hypothetical protein